MNPMKAITAKALLTACAITVSWWLLSCCGSVVHADPYTPPTSNRSDLLLDDSWRFILADVPGATNIVFDDSSWTAITLPHTWNNLDGQDGGSYFRGIGWYRRHYTVDGSYTNRQIFLKFDGANIVADVYVNGNFVGEHQGGFAAFVFDVTPYVNVGADNLIAVKVNNASNSSIPPLSADFTFFGGIYREAHLLVTDPVQVSPLDYGSPGVYLKTTSVSSNSANLQVTTVVSNASASPATVTVRAIVTDAATNIVAALTNIVTLSASSVSNVVASAIISNPHLWDGLNDPYLYQTFVEVYNGSNLTDLVAQPLGFRWFSVDPTNGFFLNGQHYDLHGVNMHQDWLNCGWALSSAQRQTNFMLLKEIGATAVRLSHYQHHDETYQLGDQSGIILWSEVPNINNITSSAAYYTNTLQQLREMIRQRYNHPSVVCWGLFNEITLQSGPSPSPLISLEAQLAAQEDPTRPTTAAANSSDNDPTTFYSQLICFNKYFGWYNGVLADFAPWADNFHAAYPARTVGVSEYGCGANVYQHSEDPVTEPANAGSYHPEEYQNLFHESYWQAMKARPFLWGKYVWNMFDFASDGRNEGNAPAATTRGSSLMIVRFARMPFTFTRRIGPPTRWFTLPAIPSAIAPPPSRPRRIPIAILWNCSSIVFHRGRGRAPATSSPGRFRLPAVPTMSRPLAPKAAPTSPIHWCGLWCLLRHLKANRSPPAVSRRATILLMAMMGAPPPGGPVPTGPIRNGGEWTWDPFNPLPRRSLVGTTAVVGRTNTRSRLVMTTRTTPCW